MNAVSFDIDGIMNNYPQCWVDYVNTELCNSFLTKDDIKKTIGGHKYRLLKYQYRHSEYKANLKFNKTTISLADIFRDKGYEIIVSTSRPINDKNYKDLKKLTIGWIKKNKFPYDLLVDKKKELAKKSYYSNISFHIEDDYHYAQEFANKGVKTILITAEDLVIDNPNIINVKSLEELLKCILDNKFKIDLVGNRSK